MSLSIDGFWKSGVWTETFWADGFWYEGDPVVPPVIERRGGGIDHQVKRKKSTLADRPNEQLENIIETSFESIKASKEAFKELTSKKASKNVKKQANKIVKDYSDAHRPSFNNIDWTAFSENLEATQRLLNLYRKEIADEVISENLERFKLKQMRIEADNVEFLLMH